MGTHVRSVSIIVNRQSMVRLISLILLFAFWMPSAYSVPACLDNFKSTYPNSSSGDISTSGGARCQLCHVRTNGGSPWNGYGYDLLQNGALGVGHNCNPEQFATALAADVALLKKQPKSE